MKNLLERAQSANSHLLSSDQSPVVDQGDRVETRVASLQSQFAALMPDDGETGRRITADAIQLVRANPRLKQCDPVSVLGGLVTCAQLNLRPGVGGEAWLIPMNVRKRVNGEWVSIPTAQLIIGYQGFLTLARRSKELADIQVVRVYENDRFEFSWDYDRLVHEVDWRDPGEVIGWYTIVKLSNGVTRVNRPWSVDMMKVHRDQFAMAKKADGTVVGPWRDNFNAMADKTALLQALKTAPRSFDLQAGVYADGTVRGDVDRTASIFDTAERPQITPSDDATATDRNDMEANNEGDD